MCITVFAVDHDEPFIKSNYNPTYSTPHHLPSIFTTIKCMWCRVCRVITDFKNKVYKIQLQPFIPYPTLDHLPSIFTTVKCMWCRVCRVCRVITDFKTKICLIVFAVDEPFINSNYNPTFPTPTLHHLPSICTTIKCMW